MKRIKLTQGKSARVSNRDYDSLNQSKWYAQKTKQGDYYAKRAEMVDGKKVFILMHRVILGIDGTDIKGDHKDGDRLNNVRKNLRIATSADNSHNTKMSRNNTSGYRGVNLCPDGKYQIRIGINNKRVILNRINDPIQAAKIYDFWARDLHGEFASCNFLGTVVGVDDNIMGIIV